jgi:hypothetical protein
MGVFVLVHGHHGWRPVRDLLEAAGQATHVPTLTGHGDRGHLAGPGLRLRDHVAEVVALLAGSRPAVPTPGKEERADGSKQREHVDVSNHPRPTRRVLAR